MKLADLSMLGGKGYLLAVDRHDMYGALHGINPGIALSSFISFSYFDCMTALSILN